MCSLIPDQPRSLETGCSLAADGASAAASPRSLEAGSAPSVGGPGNGHQPRSLETGQREGVGEGRAVVLWLSSNDGAQAGDFVNINGLWS